MYKLTSGPTIIRLSDGASIPMAEGNVDYESYLTWVAEGGAPEPADLAAPPSPLEQIRALERQYADDQAKLTRQSLLALALDKAVALPQAVGLTRLQVHTLLMARDTGYAGLYNLEQEIATLRDQIE